MDAARKERLDALLKQSETWPTKEIFIEVYTQNQAGVQVKTIVDICGHIGCSTNDEADRQQHQRDFHSRRMSKPSRLKKMYLSPMYNSRSVKGRGAVMRYVAGLFDKCGGGITGTGTSAASSTEIVFRCSRHRAANINMNYVKKEDKKKSVVTTTARPRPQDEKCLWRFTLYFEQSDVDDTMGRWYFYENGIGNRFHNGQLRSQ